MSIHESLIKPNTRQEGIKTKGNASLEQLRIALTEKANEYGVPLITRLDEIKKAGLLNKATVPCLEYYHPQHSSDYFHFIITCQKQGLYTYFEFYYHGSSPNNGLMNKRDQAKKSGTITGALSSAVRGAIANSKQAQIQEEENWYATMDDIIEELINGE